MTLLKNNESQSQKFFSSEGPNYTKKSNESQSQKSCSSQGPRPTPTTKSNESQSQKYLSSQGQKVNYKKEASIKKRFPK